MALHILENRQNLVGWQLVLNYIRSPLTHYFLESCERAAYMEIHPKQAWNIFNMRVALNNIDWNTWNMHPIFNLHFAHEQFWRVHLLAHGFTLRWMVYLKPMGVTLECKKVKFWVFSIVFFFVSLIISWSYFQKAVIIGEEMCSPYITLLPSQIYWKFFSDLGCVVGDSYVV